MAAGLSSFPTIFSEEVWSMSRFLLPAGMVALLFGAFTLAAQVRDDPRQSTAVPPQPPSKAGAADKAVIDGGILRPADKQGQRRRGRNRVYLGVLTVPVEDMSKRTLKKLKLANTDGVYVIEVMPDSPADDAGLKHGDVITHVNGKLIEDEEELVKDLNQVGAGKPVKLTVFREGKKQEIKAELDEAPAGEHAGPAGGEEQMEEVMGMCHHNAQRLEHLERKISRLEKRLAEMEKGRSAKNP
jgi:membrane-associated protease RseP (regulator of RpoE activity)